MTWLTPAKSGEGERVAGTHATAEILALSVHGPVGVLDLVVPASATAPDVALEYARQAGLDAVPVLRTRVGAAIAADLPLARAGVAPGDLLVATLPDAPPPPLVEPSRAAPAEHPLAAPSVLWFAVVAGIAVLAGWCAGVAPSEEARQATVALLVVGAVVGVAPVGRFAPHRVLAAPAFAAAAAFVVAWDPHPVRLPMVLGVTGMAAALAGATGRALSTRAEEALRVWIVVGSALFLLTGLGALLGAPPRVVWSLLLVGAVLAARFVPALAVDVPDQYLVDLERLAVTAWSARDRPTGRRGRSVVPLEAVGVVATRGARIVTAAAAAVLVVAAVSAPLLLATARLPIDRVGARCLVGLGGAALLLASRGYRHAAARALLRTAGLACWAALLVTVLPEVSPHAAGWVALAAVLLAVPLVVVAVAAGRGWRSAWWSRRAEVAEGLCGALAVASLVASAGWFRQLWELASLWELGT
jgi:hypothetical protein